MTSKGKTNGKKKELDRGSNQTSRSTPQRVGSSPRKKDPKKQDQKSRALHKSEACKKGSSCRNPKPFEEKVDKIAKTTCRQVARTNFYIWFADHFKAMVEYLRTVSEIPQRDEVADLEFLADHFDDLELVCNKLIIERTYLND